MLKLFGAGLILASPVWFSVSRYGAHLRQDRLLGAFLKALELCAGQIRCSLTALPELAVLMKKQGPEELRPFWNTLQEGLSENRADLDALWQNALAETGLSPQACRILAAFPWALRSYDTDKITRELGRLGEELAQYRRETAVVFRRDFKMYTGVQVSAALLLMILLF